MGASESQTDGSQPLQIYLSHSCKVGHAALSYTWILLHPAPERTKDSVTDRALHVSLRPGLGSRGPLRVSVAETWMWRASLTCRVKGLETQKTWQVVQQQSASLGTCSACCGLAHEATLEDVAGVRLRPEQSLKSAALQSDAPSGF